MDEVIKYASKRLSLLLVEFVAGLSGFLIIGLKFSWWAALAVFLIAWAQNCRLQNELLKNENI